LGRERERERKESDVGNVIKREGDREKGKDRVTESDVGNIRKRDGERERETERKEETR
jgi:hypothetical protein